MSHVSTAIVALDAATVSTPATTCSRGGFDEIVSLTVVGQPLSPKAIIGRFKAALPESFVEFDKASRGDALNLDLYGYDPDQGVAVVQIRHAFRRYRNGFLNVRKDYVLVGVNEITGQAFRHPVGASAVRAGIRAERTDPAAAVKAAQRWMWGVSAKQLEASLEAGMRQGDVLMVAEKAPSQADIAEEMAGEVVIADSHLIRASRIIKLRNGRILAFAPSLRHIKGQHIDTFADDERWHSIRVADAAATWKWGVRLGD